MTAPATPGRAQLSERPATWIDAEDPTCLLILCGGLAAVAVAYLWWAGLELAVAGAAVGVMSIQAVTGGYWWVRARGGCRLGSAELIGMGLSLGTFLALLAAQLLRPTPIAGWGWLVPGALTLAHVAWRTRRLRTGPGERVASVSEHPSMWRAGRRRSLPRHVVTIPLVTILGLCITIPMVQDHPFDWSGWWRIHQDFQYHEAVVSTLRTLGTGTSAWFEGDPVRYHWFVHSWAGTMSDTLPLPPFAALTRLAYLVGVVGSGCLAWSAARSLASGRWVGELAAALVVAGTYVGVPISIGLGVGAEAPAQAMGTIWLLGAVIAIIRVLDGSVPATSGVVLVAALSMAATGGKVNHAAVVVGGLWLMVLWSAAVGPVRPIDRRLIWMALGSTAGALAGFVYALAGSSGDGLRVALNAGFGDTVGFSSLPVIGVVTGIVGVMLAVGPRWAWLLVRSNEPRRPLRPAVALVGCIGVAGVLLSFGLEQDGRSQDHFLLSATVVGAVLTAASVGRLVHDPPATTVPSSVIAQPVGSFRPAVPLLVGIASGVVSAVAYYVVDRSSLPRSVVLIAPAIPWLGAFVVHRSQAPADRSSSAGRRAPVLVLAVASVAAGALYPLQSLVGANSDRSAGATEAGAPLAWTTSYLDAGEWVRANTQRADLFITNRMCSDARAVPPDCGSLWYLASALTGRQFVVEGFGYGVESPRTELTERVELSLRATNDPTVDTVADVRAMGVRFLWVDLLARHGDRLDDSYDLEFSNDAVAIYAVPEEGRSTP